jgi:hypothetical protein
MQVRGPLLPPAFPPRASITIRPPSASCFRVFETPLLSSSAATGAANISLRGTLRRVGPGCFRASLLPHPRAVLVPGARVAGGVGYFEVERMWVFAIKAK